jgi:DNA-binding transcriptional ArsR family regulator
LQALSDGQRHRIVSLLMDRNLTAKELSKALGIGRTRLYYHLEILERHGLIRVTGTQLISGILERRFRAVARSFRVDRALLSSAAPAAKIVRAQGAIVESVAADYYASAPHALAGDSLIWRGFLQLNTKRRRELRKRLLAVVERFRDPDPHGVETEAAIVLFPTQGKKR